MKGAKCSICGHEHWLREPHILPKNAPSETRSKPKMNAGIVEKLIKKAKQALGLDEAPNPGVPAKMKPRVKQSKRFVKPSTSRDRSTYAKAEPTKKKKHD